MEPNEEQKPRFDIGQFGPEVKRVLVVAAHPDDLETACGGTMALLISQGIEVSLLLGTDGDIGTHDLSLHQGNAGRHPPPRDPGGGRGPWA